MKQKCQKDVTNSLTADHKTVHFSQQYAAFQWQLQRARQCTRGPDSPDISLDIFKETENIPFQNCLIDAHLQPWRICAIYIALLLLRLRPPIGH